MMISHTTATSILRHNRETAKEKSPMPASHSRLPSIIAAIAAVLLGLHTGSSRAAYISEYFDYGATSGDLRGKGIAGGGWSGAWDPNNNRTLDADYSTVNLNITHPGYQNQFNAVITGSASALGGTGNRTSGVDRIFTDGLTGTIWISMLAQYTSTSQQLAVLGFEDGNLNGTDQALGIIGSAGVIRWNSNSSNIQTNLTINTPYLFLARIDVDYSAGLDRLTAWVNPDLSNLGSGTVIQGTDVIGTALDGIFVFNNSGNIDAIRISNDASAFRFVTTGVIPEPASAMLLGFAGLAMLRRRR